MSKKGFKQTEIGTIPEDWEFEELVKHATIIMGQSPESIYYNSIGDGALFLQGIRTFGHIYPKYDTWTTKITKLAKKDSVLLSVRAPVGEVNIADKDVCIGRGLMSIDGKNNKFIFYLFKGFKNYVVNKETGTVYGSVTRDDISKLKFPFPEESEQSAITKILSDLDEKIELNHQMNKALETIGQLIFKRWFVDFEFPNENGKPYKSSGGEMINSELGKIPKGWEVDNVTKLFTLEYGWHLPVWDRKEGDIPVYGSGGLTGYHNSHFAEGPGIIIGRAGKVGVESVYYSHSNFCPIETTFYVLTENKRIIRYLYFFLKTLETVNTGSSVPNLSRRDIHSAKIIIPNIKTIEVFDKVVETLFDHIRNNEIEIDYLSQIRDSLLPRLMSGRIRVPMGGA